MQHIFSLYVCPYVYVYPTLYYIAFIFTLNALYDYVPIYTDDSREDDRLSRFISVSAICCFNNKIFRTISISARPFCDYYA